MPKIFVILEKVKPAYDLAYKIFMFICKVLLVADICITSYAVLGRYCQQFSKTYGFLSFLGVIRDPSWSEQVVLTLMSYMAVLSAALAIRRGAHIRMTAFDVYLPKKALKVLDVLADIAVMGLGLIMLIYGWKYAMTVWRFKYESMPTVSRGWMYLPIPIAGLAMIVFELEAVVNDIKAFYIEEEEVAKQ